MTRSPGGEMPATDPQQETGLRERIEARKAAYGREGMGDFRDGYTAALDDVLSDLAALPAPAAPHPPCSTCDGTGLIDWAPGQQRNSDEEQQPCPDCVAPRPVRNGVVVGPTAAPQPETGTDEAIPRCSCGSVALYAEDPPRLGPHHNVACLRYRHRTGNPAVRHPQPAAPTDGDGKA